MLASLWASYDERQNTTKLITLSTHRDDNPRQFTIRKVDPGDVLLIAGTPLLALNEKMEGVDLANITDEDLLKELQTWDLELR